jgi:hypothetical protein
VGPVSTTTGNHMLPSENHPTPTVFAGLDVGKSFHHLCALTADGKRVFDRKVDNDETELRTVLTQLLQRGRRTPRRLRRTRTRHPTVRHIHPRRKPLQTRKPRPEISSVPLRLRSPERPRQQGLLRQEASRGQTAQRRPHLPSCTPCSAPASTTGHPPPPPPSPLDNHIETPPATGTDNRTWACGVCLRAPRRYPALALPGSSSSRTWSWSPCCPPLLGR